MYRLQASAPLLLTGTPDLLAQGGALARPAQGCPCAESLHMRVRTLENYSLQDVGVQLVRFCVDCLCRP